MRLVTGAKSRAAVLNFTRKEKKSVSRRGLGKLKRLLEVPIDVFCEVRFPQRYVMFYLVLIHSDFGAPTAP